MVYTFKAYKGMSARVKSEGIAGLYGPERFRYTDAWSFRRPSVREKG
jgi:hypothetical protein